MTALARFYKVEALLGEGNFGRVFHTVDTRTGGVAAAKVEPMGVEFPQLAYEYRVLHDILHGCYGIPEVHCLLVEEDHYVMLMDKCGGSVESLRRAQPTGRLPLVLVARIAQQALERLYTCHIHGLVHRDLKPENLLFGDGVHTSASTLYLIDFGLCKRFIAEDGSHIRHCTDKPLVGTPKFASRNALMGHEQSMRDDVEALGYVLVYLALGRLPWEGLPMLDGHANIADAKSDNALDALCTGLPPVFRATLRHARGLAYGAEPAYTYLQAMWKTLEVQEKRAGVALSPSSLSMCPAAVTAAAAPATTSPPAVSSIKSATQG